MITIRPDARERLEEIRSLIVMLQDAKAREILEQHLKRLERIVDMLETSLEEYEEPDFAEPRD